MKKILNALFLTLLAVFTFSSCSDVPAPYEILGEGEVPGLTGDGTKENPYNIEAAQKKQDGSVAWVQGYIVGVMENEYDDKGEFAGNKAKFEPPFSIATNVLIAESPDETNENKCLPVKLKGGSDLSNALNLKDHPENKGGILLIQGELSAGFGKAALINTTAAVFNNKEVGEQGGEELDPNNPLGLDTSVAPLVDFSNSFDDVQHQADYSKAGWINKAVQGKRIWQGAIYDPQKYLAASTYGVNSGETAEYWFVTPYFTVSADKKFTFKATVNKYSETMSLKVFFLQLKDGKMERQEISVNGIPVTGTYQWTSDLTVDLSSYVGQNGFIGFQYVAKRGEEVQTYGIDDILYGKGGGETPGGNDPFGLNASDPKSTFVADFEEITDFNQNYSLEGWINKAIQSSNVWQTGIYNTVDKYIKATPYNVAANETMEAWFITPAFTVKAANKFTFDCAGANWKDDMTLKVFFLQKDANGDVTRNEIAVSEIPTSGSNFKWVKDINVDLNSYTGKVGFVGFQYTVVSTGVNKSLPTYQIDNMKYAAGEGGGTDPEPAGTELFISEYVESFKGNNKYVEIYNPTTKSIDLSGYALKMNANGKKEGEEIVWTSIHNQAFTGNIEPGQTVVFAHNQAVNYTGEVVKCSNMFFNGDDAIGLFKGETLIDLMGTPGVKEKFGENVVLRRVATVTSPSTTYALAEWSEIKLTSADDDTTVGVSGLGSHTVE